MCTPSKHGDLCLSSTQTEGSGGVTQARLRQSSTLLHVHVQEQTHIFANVIYMHNTLLGYEIPMYMYHYVYGNTGMYIHV